MRTVERLVFTDEEVKAWQQQVGGPVLGVVGKVLEGILGEAQEVFENEGAGIEAIKVAQGMVRAVRRVEEWSRQIILVDLEQKEQAIGENIEIDGGDVDVDF